MTLTGAIVVAPLAALAGGVWLAWGAVITVTDVLLGLAPYAVGSSRDFPVVGRASSRTQRPRETLVT